MSYLLWFLVSPFLATGGLLLMFAWVISIKKISEAHPTLKPFIILNFGLQVVVSGLTDILFNYTVAVPIFKEWPQKPDKPIWKDATAYTLTRRLQQYKYGPGGWRRNRALWWCDNVIERIEPGHCTK